MFRDDGACRSSGYEIASRAFSNYRIPGYCSSITMIGLEELYLEERFNWHEMK